MDYVYKISNLQKDYNKRTVLNINKLNIQKGQITSLIGPSGAGKSTFLHLLNNIELPTKGTIQLGEYMYPENGKIDIGIRRQMSMVFQKPIVFDKNVYDNIAYGLSIRKVSKTVIREQVEEIAEKIGLRDMLKNSARTLSGGEMQRVALARAIIVKPSVLFMDEATTNLDPSNVLIIEDLVRYVNSSYKTSVIIATHNMHQAKRLSNQTVFLLNGELVEAGETEQIFVNPQNTITKSFIEGDMVC
jgi:tungstate transport system ATP-binding protein